MANAIGQAPEPMNNEPMRERRSGICFYLLFNEEACPNESIEGTNDP